MAVFKDIYIYDITKGGSNTIVFKMEIPSGYDQALDRLWVEFPAPWPNAIAVTNEFECGYSSRWSF